MANNKVSTIFSLRDNGEPNEVTVNEQKPQATDFYRHTL